MNRPELDRPAGACAAIEAMPDTDERAAAIDYLHTRYVLNPRRLDDAPKHQAHAFGFQSPISGDDDA